MKTRGLRTPASINAILLLSIFTFVFLGVEYLYVNMMSRMVGEDQTVIAQNYALGISVLGFILYPVLNRAVHERFKALTYLFYRSGLHHLHFSNPATYLIRHYPNSRVDFVFSDGAFRQFGSLFGCLYHPWGANTGPAGGFCLCRRVFFCNISITT